jgi:hypothetical protein
LLKSLDGQFVIPTRQFVDVNIGSALGVQLKLNEARKEYEACTEKLHSLRKKAGTKEVDLDKLNKVEADEAKTKQQFELLQYQYAKKMSELLQDVPYSLIDGLLGYVSARNDYYRKGSSLVGGLEPEMKQFSAHAAALKRAGAEARLEEMRQRLDSTNGRVGSIIIGGPSSSSSGSSAPTATTSITTPVNTSSYASSNISNTPNNTSGHGGDGFDKGQRQLSGYLWMKTKRRWKKRWVSVINGKLMYYKNWKNHQPKGAI